MKRAKNLHSQVGQRSGEKTLELGTITRGKAKEICEIDLPWTGRGSGCCTEYEAGL
jgi:hypothetical protein